MKNKNHKKGFAALYIMLMAASVTVVLTLAIANEMVFALRRANLEQEAAEARALANRCAEDILMQVRNNTSYTASNSASYGGNSCSYSVSGSNPNKTITIMTASDNVYKRINIATTQLNPTFIVKWTEVSD